MEIGECYLCEIIQAGLIQLIADRRMDLPPCKTNCCQPIPLYQTKLYLLKLRQLIKNPVWDNLKSVLLDSDLKCNTLPITNP